VSEPSFVIDASAILALLQEEPGAGYVEASLPRCAISSVNLSEVIQKADQYGACGPGIEMDLEGLGLTIEPFTPLDARLTAAIWSAAPSSGLSLADRACIALAFRPGVPAINHRPGVAPTLLRG
jgi:PIN domain nuclease of toxin-antitoxin system